MTILLLLLIIGIKVEMGPAFYFIWVFAFLSNLGRDND